MEAVILKTVSIGTIDYTSGIMKDRVENFSIIFLIIMKLEAILPLWEMVVHKDLNKDVEEAYFKAVTNFQIILGL